MILKSRISEYSVKVSADSINFSRQRSTSDYIEKELELARALVAIKYAFQAFKVGNYPMAEEIFEEVLQVIDITGYPKWDQFLRVKEWLEDRFYTRK
jgi:ATP-dependent DNA helicase PIF1